MYTGARLVNLRFFPNNSFSFDLTQQDEEQQEPLSSVDIVPEVPFNLEEFIAENVNSSMLDLSMKELTGQDMGALAEALRNNTTLTTITIDESEIGDEGLQHLINALETNTALKTLEMGSNKFEENALQPLADSLKKNTGDFNLEGVGVDTLLTISSFCAEYRAFENLIRIRPIPEYDPLADAITLLKDMRSKSVMSDMIPKSSQCRIIKDTFEYDRHTVDTYWIDYPVRSFQKNSDKLFIYLHGGGYLIGDIHSYSGFECELSRMFNESFLHVEYRLSPEHSVPAAVNDTIAVYQILLRQGISPSQIIIIGDSAGGGLALLTIQTLVTQQLQIPSGVIVLSPWSDLTASGESFIHNIEIDLLFTHDDVRWVTAQVLANNQSPHNPHYSPLFGSFKGFPPMYITVGTAELLYDDSKRVFQKAQEANMNVIFEEGLHMIHIYPLFFSFFPEAQNTLNNINQWIQIHFQAN
ncbi:hypothetical protein I4U23_011637 [Adineta vaga]|nr:hypothetical protein I4U23_011637 [Adineta vaga]